jgi:hypothetical protein
MVSKAVHVVFAAVVDYYHESLEDLIITAHTGSLGAIEVYN